jgi:hypothetical protein
MRWRHNIMAIGMNTELLEILRSGAFGGTGADPVEERRSAAAAALDRRRTKRLVGLAIADQVSQRDARIRWFQSVRR